jgi:hypothetical protein
MALVREYFKPFGRFRLGRKDKDGLEYRSIADSKIILEFLSLVLDGDDVPGARIIHRQTLSAEFAQPE